MDFKVAEFWAPVSPPALRCPTVGLSASMVYWQGAGLTSDRSRYKSQPRHTLAG